MTVKNGFYFIIIVAFTGLFSSCATIIGGSKYYAKVQVTDHPNAKIKYEGGYQGTGEATFKAKRKNVNNFTVTIEEEGCETQTKNFTQRKFRGWAFVGTVVGWTGVISTAPYILPWGVATDLATGSLWKPDINENGVTKQDFNHYMYTIDYTGCSDKQTNISSEKKQNVKSKADRLRELKQLLDEKVITQEEYAKEKKKILEE